MTTDDAPKPHVLFYDNDVTITRSVGLGYARGEGPIITTPVRDFRVTYIRLDYEWTGTSWAATIGPVNGHPLDGTDIAHNRERAIRPRDHTADGWPTWLHALAAEHMPTTTITITES